VSSVLSLCRQAATSLRTRLPSATGNGKGASLIERLSAARHPESPARVLDEIREISNATFSLHARFPRRNDPLFHRNGRPNIAELQQRLTDSRIRLSRMPPDRIHDIVSTTLNRADRKSRIVEVQWALLLTQAHSAGDNATVEQATSLLGKQHPAVRCTRYAGVPVSEIPTLAQRVHSEESPSVWFHAANVLYQCGALPPSAEEARNTLRARREAGFRSLAVARADVAQAHASATMLGEGPRREQALAVLCELSIAVADATDFWRSVLDGPQATRCRSMRDLACTWLGESDHRVVAYRARPPGNAEPRALADVTRVCEWRTLVATATGNLSYAVEEQHFLEPEFYLEDTDARRRRG